MTCEIFRQFVAPVLVVRIHPAYHAGVFQSAQVAVDGRLGEVVAAAQDVRDRERVRGIRQDVYQSASLARVPLAAGPQP